MGIGQRTATLFALLVSFAQPAAANGFLYVALDRGQNSSVVTMIEFEYTASSLSPPRRAVTVEGARVTDLVVSHDRRFVVWVVNVRSGPFSSERRLVVFDRQSGAATTYAGLGLSQGGKLYADSTALRFYYIRSTCQAPEPQGVNIIFDESGARAVRWGAGDCGLVAQNLVGMSPDSSELYAVHVSLFHCCQYQLEAVDTITGQPLRQMSPPWFTPDPMVRAVTATRDQQRYFASLSRLAAPPVFGTVAVYNRAATEIARRDFATPVADVELDERRGRAYVAQADRLEVVDLETLEPLATSIGGQSQVAFDRAEGVLLNLATTVDSSGSCQSARLELWSDDLQPNARFTAPLAGECPAMAIATSPQAPENLTEQVNGRRVTLAWTGVMGATSYVIEVGSGPGLSNLGQFTVAAATQLVVDNVPVGTYHVRVRAVNDLGAGSPSSEVLVAVP